MTACDHFNAFGPDRQLNPVLFFLFVLLYNFLETWVKLEMGNPAQNTTEKRDSRYWWLELRVGTTISALVRRFAHITVGFRFIARLVVSIQTLTIAWDVVNIPVLFVNEYHHPAEAC